MAAAPGQLPVPAAARRSAGSAGGVADAPPAGYVSLGLPPHELALEHTLPTGQSFRWRRTGDGEFTGVVGRRVVRMVQTSSSAACYRVLARCPRGGAPAAGDDAALAAYFNAATRFADLSDLWAAADARYAAVRKVVGGARVLLQDPLECLVSFICSSNNSIPRITSMVERLCTDYGTLLLADGGAANSALDCPASRPYHAFPTLDQLEAASEARLRAAGFGYRAKYVAGTVDALAAKPGGGDAWLLSLRDAPYADAAAALCELPGVGPKVAACVCLFALNKHAAVPVDTHVWQLAVRHYTPHLRGKAVNRATMDVVERAFVDRFGEHAGWAHNALFIAELASVKKRLAEEGAAVDGNSASESSASESGRDSDSDGDYAPEVKVEPVAEVKLIKGRMDGVRAARSKAGGKTACKAEEGPAAAPASWKRRKLRG